MKTSGYGVLGLVVLYAVAGAAAEYAGWTVGDPWDGYGTILRSSDSGATWMRQGSGQIADTGMAGVFAVDPYTAWVVGYASDGYATIYHTTDGGGTWTRMGFGQAALQGASLLKVSAYGDNNIWAVGPGTILHSSDSGATWTNQIPAGYESVHLQGVYTPDGVTVWAAGDLKDGFATILKSTDAGLTWTRQTGGDVDHLSHVLGVSAVDADTAWAIGGTNGSQGWVILGTTDGGATWTEQASGSHDGNEIFAVSTSMVWGASDSTISWSTDGGAHWDSHTSYEYTMGLSAVNSQEVWAVSAGLHGTILHSADGGGTWDEQGIPGETLPGLWTISFARTPIPEPVSGALLALAGLFALRWRHR